MHELSKECKPGIDARRSEVHETFRRRGIDLDSPGGRRRKEGEISKIRVRRYIRKSSRGVGQDSRKLLH